MSSKSDQDEEMYMLRGDYLQGRRHPESWVLGTEGGPTRPREAPGRQGVVVVVEEQR